ILTTAFLAVEMKCARCHDAPFHAGTQSDLFHLAAMLKREPIVLPKTSSVAPAKLNAPQSLISATLKPGDAVGPAWTLSHLLSDFAVPEPPPGRADDPRHRLAALITTPANERFAQVMVNRIWRRYMGRGLVEPPHDWERAKPLNPELLTWLAREFVASGYDLKHVARLILQSKAYQRQASSDVEIIRLGLAPERRRLGPELLADALHDAFGRSYDSENLCLDIEGVRSYMLANNFGAPRRAWQFVYLSNDRDRQSLNLPRAQTVTELLAAFGWEGDRQSSTTDRRVEPSVLQPALLANGVAARRLVRLSDEAPLTDVVAAADDLDGLLEELFLRILTRPPSEAERAAFREVLAPGFAERVVSRSKPIDKGPRPTQPYVAWVNHLDAEASEIRLVEEERALRGEPPTGRLDPDWRERMEDVLWALLNAPEQVYLP
ncbi:MAG: DUF1553 domain-containing protein, partial [Planctomycetia bacterium]